MRLLFASCLAAALATALPAAARAASVAIVVPSAENVGGTVIVRQSDGAASLVNQGLTSSASDLTAKLTESYLPSFPYLGVPYSGYATPAS